MKSARTLTAEEIAETALEDLKNTIYGTATFSAPDADLIADKIEALIDAKIAVALSRPVDDR